MLGKPPLLSLLNLERVIRLNLLLEPVRNHLWRLKQYTILFFSAEARLQPILPLRM